MTAGRIGIPSGYRTGWAPWPAFTANPVARVMRDNGRKAGTDPVARDVRDNGREAETDPVARVGRDNGREAETGD